jgi:hypothetical protein
MKKVLICILAGLSVAILFLSGCLTLEETNEESAEFLRLSINDGNTDLGQDEYFTTEDNLLKCEQTGGDPIDWTEYIVYCEVKDSSDRVTLNVAMIGTDPAKKVSKTGDVIILRSSVNEHFKSGDYLEVTIVKGDNKVYESTNIRLA